MLIYSWSIRGVTRGSALLLPTARSLPELVEKPLVDLVGLPRLDTEIETLEHLDQFVKAASLRELELGDEIVRDHDEYIIHTNLSRRLEKQPNVLSERGRNECDDFARHGLPWALGLARIELGAMLAGFTFRGEEVQDIILQAEI